MSIKQNLITQERIHALKGIAQMHAPNRHHSFSLSYPNTRSRCAQKGPLTHRQIQLQNVIG